MKAMILAAGKGTRVRPLTNVLPKPMIPLIRKPIMEAIIDHLKRHAFDEIYVNTSYLSRSIEDYFRDGDRLGVAIAYSYENQLVDGEFIDKPLGSAGGMRRIQDRCGFFDDSFAVLCADALIDVDLTEVLRFHRASGAIATIVTKPVPREDVCKYGVVIADETGRVRSFQEKPKVEEALSNTINTGIYLFDPKIFDYIPSATEFDIGSQLFPRLIEAGEKVCAISLPFEWVDIGCVADFWEATQLILQGKVEGILGDYTRVSVNAMLDNRIVFAGKFIELNGDAIYLNDADLNWLIADARKPETNDSAHDYLRASMSVTALV